MRPTDPQGRRGNRHPNESHGAHKRSIPVSVLDHERFLQSFTPPVQKFDGIDQAAADPLVDRIGQRHSEHEATRVLRILDELELGGRHG